MPLESGKLGTLLHCLAAEAGAAVLDALSFLGELREVTRQV
jgi:hypothetical protein